MVGRATWLTDPAPNSVRRYVFDVFVNGTHPLLPWFAFLCAGIVLGRLFNREWWRPAAFGAGFTLFAVATMAKSFASSPLQRSLLSTSSP